MDPSNWTSKDGHFKLNINEWTLQIRHLLMDTSNWTSEDGHFKLDIKGWTLQIGQK